MLGAAITTQSSQAHLYLFPAAMLFMLLISTAYICPPHLMGTILLALPCLQGLLTFTYKP